MVGCRFYLIYTRNFFKYQDESYQGVLENQKQQYIHTQNHVKVILENLQYNYPDRDL